MKRWVAVAFCSSLCGCESTTEITIGWAPIEPAAEISKTLGPILEKSYRVSTRRLADSEALIDALLDGSVDIAIVEQPAFPIPNLSVLTPLFPSVLHVLARADGVDPDGLALRDVVSGKVYAGPAGSAGYRLVMSLAETNVIPDLDAIDLLDQRTTLLGEALAAALQVFLEPLGRRKRHLNRAQREFVRHAEPKDEKHGDIRALDAPTGAENDRLFMP